MASYPGAPVIFPARADATTIFAAHTNALQDEVAAIEAALLGQIPHEVNFGKSIKLTGLLGPPTVTADQHDYNPAGLATATQIRISTDAPRTITGIAAQPLGRLLLVLNAGGFDLTLPHESALSAATNRFFIASGLPIVLTTNAQVWLYYDASGRWRPVIAPFAAGLGAAGTWQAYTPVWTASATAPALGNGTLTGRYTIIGKTAHVQINFTLGSTSTQGTGGWYFSLPPAAFAFASVTCGHGRTSRAANQIATVVIEAGLQKVAVMENAMAGFIGSGVPAAWATGHSVTLLLTYEIP